MTSIFEGQPPKTRPKLQSKQGAPFGSFGIYNTIYKRSAPDGPPSESSVVAGFMTWIQLVNFT